MSRPMKLIWLTNDPKVSGYPYPEYVTKKPQLVCEDGTTIQGFFNDLTARVSPQDAQTLIQALNYIDQLESWLTSTARSCKCTGWHHNMECEFHIPCY